MNALRLALELDETLTVGKLHEFLETAGCHGANNKTDIVVYVDPGFFSVKKPTLVVAIGEEASA